MNRLPPFGDELRDAAAAVPDLTLSVERASRDGEDIITLQVDIANLGVASNDPRHWLVVLAGDSDNVLHVNDRFQ